MPRISPPEKDLIRRYLLWCYKSTKESLDRIDRKFTQVAVDRLILKHLKKQSNPDEEYTKKVQEFDKYLLNKEQEGLDQKFSDVDRGSLRPDYLYLQNRLGAVEKAIAHFLGVRALSKIKLQYEQEMTRRILESKDH